MDFSFISADILKNQENNDLMTAFLLELSLLYLSVFMKFFSFYLNSAVCFVCDIVIRSIPVLFSSVNTNVPPFLVIGAVNRSVR